MKFTYRKGINFDVPWWSAAPTGRAAYLGLWAATHPCGSRVKGLGLLWRLALHALTAKVLKNITHIFKKPITSLLNIKVDLLDRTVWNQFRILYDTYIILGELSETSFIKVNIQRTASVRFLFIKCRCSAHGLAVENILH